MTMDARKQRVLQAIVALYGLEGEPVGSSVLATTLTWQFPAQRFAMRWRR